MAKENYCSECEIEFKIRHDSDNYMLVMYCPFCAASIEADERQTSYEDVEEE